MYAKGESILVTALVFSSSPAPTRDVTLLVPTYLEQKSTPPVVVSLLGSPALSLSNHSLLITGSKLREPNRGAIFWNEGRSEDGKREGKKGKYSFTDHTRLGWSTALFLSFSFSLCEIGNDGGKKPKKTFLVAGLSARLCLRGGASGSLYKRSWPGGGRVCLPFKRGPRLAALL